VLSPGSETRVAAQIKELKHQRAIVAEEVEKLLDDFPLSRVLMSIPGVRIKTAATVLLTIGDAGSFTSAGHLASYAGIGPVTRRSGTSIRGEFPASCHHPASKAYHQKKRSQGKKHNAAVICTRP
jgi:transposase